MQQRQINFQSLGLGMFLHCGLYAKFGKGEWYWKMYHLTEEEYYQQVGKNFKLDFDFKSLVKWAKDNDFTYLVLTAKHHDGFALYDSENNSQYDINWLTSQKDLVKEFIDECLKNKIQPFLYYATMDWLNYDFETHLQDIYQNIEFLLKKYGTKIKGFWFDGNWSEPEKDWKLDELYKMIRSYNPSCIIISNTGLEHKGEAIHPEIDSTTFEQGGFNNKLDLPFESVFPITDHWGNAKNDFNYKSLPQIIKTFINTRVRGGNILINISLNEKQEIDSLDKAIIEKLHEWSKINDYWWKKPLKNSLVRTDYLIYNDYLILTNVKSGAHVDNIHFGNELGQEIEVEINNLKRMYYLDTKEEIVFWEKNNKIYFKPKSFEYGFNTIYRFIKLKRGEGNV